MPDYIITDHATTYISPETQIGTGTVIKPNTTIEGKTIIGENCVIGPNTVINAAVVGNGSNVGPFAHLRPGAKIGDNVHIGSFVEIKNSIIGDGSKVPHHAYIGDATVGEKVNFGCGSITANYDGKNKYRCTIGDGAFIGCNTNLIAPVVIEENAQTAAGSTITMDVPGNTLAVARSRQINKIGWVKND